MNVVVKSVDDMTPTEYLACYRANFGRNGHMREDIVEARRFDMGALVIMLWDGPPDDIKSLRAWSLVTPVRPYRWYSAPEDSTYIAQFWVKRQYRRQGLGGILMQEVKKIDPIPHVIPHTKASGEFFSSYEVTHPETRNHTRWVNPNKPRKG